MKISDRKFLFIDRDGVINKNVGLHKYVLNPNQFKFKTDIFNLLYYLQSFFSHYIIVTNQQCVGKKMINIKELESIHNMMLNQFKNKKIIIDKIYICQHLESDLCECRKPKKGLFIKAINDFNITNIELSNSFMIGDSISDIIPANELNISTIFLGRKENNQATYSVKNLKSIKGLFL